MIYLISGVEKDIITFWQVCAILDLLNFTQVIVRRININIQPYLSLL
jgi:hypothetical protein